MTLQSIVQASKELLDDKAAAAVLDVTPGTLSVWRSTGRYALPFLKVGRKVRYRHSDLLAWLDKRPGVTIKGILRNWGLVFTGNFLGALTVAFLMAFIFTYGFSVAPNEVGTKIGHIGELRTLGYAQYGLMGWITIFIRGMLCNWMVSTGVVGAMISSTVSGKVIAMWMPVTLFFAMAFEHSVVNMFLFPSGLMMGGNFSVLDYLVWNEIPTVMGNLVGGLAFTGLTLYVTHIRTAPKRKIV